MGTGTSMETNDTALLDAVELLAAFADKTLSPLQALQGITERIARKNPEVNAFAMLNPASLRDARESTMRWHAGTARALEGVPVTVCAEAQDAAFVHQLRDAGAVILGKTIGFVHQDAPLQGIPRNPWNVAYLAGSGAAAAAAGFFGPLHVSMSTPDELFMAAAWNGVVGLKTSFASFGIIARTVQDAALLVSIMGQPPARVGDLTVGVWQPEPCAGLDVAQTLLAAQGLTLVPVANHAEAATIDILLCPVPVGAAPLLAESNACVALAPWWQPLPTNAVGLTLPVGVGAQGLPLGVFLRAAAEREGAVLHLAQELERCVNAL